MKQIILSNILLLVLLVFFPNAYGEIEKLGTVSPEGIQYYWWPKLSHIEGWHHDRETSFNYFVNYYVPDGETPSTAKSVIFAKAIYKPQHPEIKSLEMFVNGDKAHFSSQWGHDFVIKESEPLKTADSQILKTLMFIPKKEGKGKSYKQVAYGEEGDFYIVFEVNAQTKKKFTEALDAFKKVVSAYKK
jgi:hypothetical protein